MQFQKQVFNVYNKETSKEFTSMMHECLYSPYGLVATYTFFTSVTGPHLAHLLQHADKSFLLMSAQTWSHVQNHHPLKAKGFLFPAGFSVFVLKCKTSSKWTCHSRSEAPPPVGTQQRWQLNENTCEGHRNHVGICFTIKKNKTWNESLLWPPLGCSCIYGCDLTRKPLFPVCSPHFKAVTHPRTWRPPTVKPASLHTKTLQMPNNKQANSLGSSRSAGFTFTYSLSELLVSSPWPGPSPGLAAEQSPHCACLLWGVSSGQR